MADSPESNQGGDGQGGPAVPSSTPSEPLAPLPMPEGLRAHLPRETSPLPAGLTGVASPATVRAMSDNALSDASTQLSKGALYADSIADSLAEALKSVKEISREFKEQNKTARDTTAHHKAAARTTTTHAHRTTPHPADVVQSATPPVPKTPAPGLPVHTEAAPGKESATTPPVPVPPDKVLPLPTVMDDDFRPFSMQENVATFGTGLQGGMAGRAPGLISRSIAQRLHNRLATSRMGVPEISKMDDNTYYDHEQGRFLDPEKDSGRIATFESRSATRSRVLGGLEATASGQGGSLTSTALGGLTARAGEIGLVAGAVVAGVNQVGGFFTGQRAAGMPYQQAMGVGTGEALKQRGEEELFRWSHFGVLSGAQASQLFQGVTAIMPNQDGRGVALDFAVNQLKSYGTSISDSLALINTSVKTGMTNFSDLSASLDGVANAAKNAGNNVGEAQKSFEANYQQAAQVIGGAGALGAATSVSTAQAGLVPALSGISLGGLNDETSLYQIAAQTNRTFSQVLGMSQQPGGTDWLAQQQQQLLNRAVTNSAGPAAIQTIQNQIRAAAQQGGGQITQAQMQTIAANAEASGLISATQISAFAQSLGIQVPSGQAGLYYVNMLSDRNSIGRNAHNSAVKTQAELTAAKSNKIDGQAIQTSHFTNVSGPGSEKIRSGSHNPMTAQEAHLGESLLGFKTADDMFGQILKGGTAAHDFGYYYNDYVKKYGTRNPVIEQLLAHYDTSRRYTVQTADGAREVTLHEGIDHYADQFRNGSAVISKGANAGDTVGDVAPGASQARAALTTGKKATAGSKPSSDGAAGRVTISLQPGLQNLFKFATSGGAYLGQAQASGIPADPFPPTNDQVTGGQ